MLKKTTFRLFVWLTSSLVLMLSGCSDDIETSNSIDCEATPSNCTELKSPSAAIFINTDIIMVENLYSITFRSTKPIVSAELNALNMNMGIIPIVFNESTGIITPEVKRDSYERTANLYFGMCAEPRMEWLLILKFADESVETVPISSYWNRQSI